MTATDSEAGYSFVVLAKAAAEAAAAAGVIEFPPGVAGMIGTGGLTSYASRYSPSGLVEQESQPLENRLWWEEHAHELKLLCECGAIAG